VKPKTFSMIDLVSSIVVTLFLLFLFIYPHFRLNAMRDDILPLCDLLIEDANGGRWEDAVTRAQEIKRRFEADETLLRLIFDHEDVDSASDAIDSALLMAKREDGTETVIETENIRGIIVYLAGIETLKLTNLF